MDITAVVGPDVPSMGRHPEDVLSFGGSSDASAIVSGITALIWSHHPDWSRDQVRERLYSTVDLYAYPFRTDPSLGRGIANAYSAVGGFTGVVITGPWKVPAYSNYTLTAQPLGEGPFTYTWTRTGSTTPSGITTPTLQGTAGAPGTKQGWTVVVRDLLEGKSISQWHTVEALTDDPPDPCDTNPHLCR